ncbi:efflux transporter, RND family, MFP subunit [Geobacter metallireducens RCH3]|uniref:Efflux pump, RND family, membrane fusion protein n=1 Tax=Geobacter metallireducens (strain ATCC 53774 / DSM 7210 / GS-15) TaxID=269799 RepID=Q39SZ1_GEOMG|nr:efflux RND transporter periplasmic adaptor subunit [Geobacter metallireducens]ABB32633.1 efflux pump, RND family, membrane fusion protein [Geobacter metallireducens GS-15]EHP87874.1 efflux transporter, RND family, MFP subunit [Geobacter metallireducens RCH3]
MANEDLGKLKIDKGALARSGGRRRPRFWIVAAVAVVVLLILFVSGVLSPAVTVETGTVTQVYPSQAYTLLNASGYVVAQRKAAVAAKVTGRLDWLGVEEGSRVKQGEILARLENLDAAAARDQAAATVKTSRASLDQAKAELTDATLAFEREKQLLKEGIVAKAEYDSAEARYRRAKAAVTGASASIVASEAALRGAQVNLEYSFIRAPFDAVVLTKNADIGDIVTPIGAAANAKAAVVTIADLGSLQVEADVSESNLETVKVGQPCEIQLDALPEVRFKGRVHMVVPTADRSKATVLVKVRFEKLDPRILPEMSAKVAFLEHLVAPGEEKPKTAVNPAAVVERGGRKVLFLVKGGRVAETPVTVGAKIGEMLEITAGAKPGDKIALKPLDKLKDGTKIKTAEK